MSVHACVMIPSHYLSHFSMTFAYFLSPVFGNDDWKVNLIFIVPASAKITDGLLE